MRVYGFTRNTRTADFRFMQRKPHHTKGTCGEDRRFRFQRSDKGQDRPPKPFTADRERNRLGAGVGIAIIKDDTVSAVVTAALPPDKGVCLFPLCRGHAVGRTVRLALQRRQAFIWVISHVVPPFAFRCRSPRKVLRRWHAPRTSGQLVPKLVPCVLPSPGNTFRTVILFSRCGSSMNYPKSTRKKCNPRNFARIAF